MFRFLKSIYGGGWRAGMASPVIINKHDGTKYLANAQELCPYTGIQAIIWRAGYHAGLSKRLCS